MNTQPSPSTLSTAEASLAERLATMRKNPALAAMLDGMPRECVLKSTRTDTPWEKHQTFEGFDPDEELARARWASRQDSSFAEGFAVEAYRNIDEWMALGNPPPSAWRAQR